MLVSAQSSPFLNKTLNFSDPQSVIMSLANGITCYQKKGIQALYQHHLLPSLQSRRPHPCHLKRSTKSKKSTKSMFLEYREYYVILYYPSSIFHEVQNQYGLRFSCSLLFLSRVISKIAQYQHVHAVFCLLFSQASQLLFVGNKNLCPRIQSKLFIEHLIFRCYFHLKCPKCSFPQLFPFSVACQKQRQEQCYIQANYHFLLRMQTTNTKLSHTTSSINPSSKRIVIQERFLLRRLLCKQPYFNIYEGVDLEASKFVNIYIKPPNVDFIFSKRVKEELRNKISPRVIWAGSLKIQKTVYKIQIHEKCGPSLKAMFNYIKTPISEKDFLLLMCQLIKLVERYGSVGYTYRQLDMEKIVFDSSPQRNQLYLLNVFPLRKRGEELPALNTRFCSKGAHLGLKSSTKDDLESICYILMHVYTQGAFLRGVSAEDYQDSKANINFSLFPRAMPPLFIDFYSYVMGLNHSDEVSYFKWRTMIYKIIGREALMKPYEWMLAKDSNQIIEEEFSEKQVEEEFDVLELEDELTAEDQMLIGKRKREMIKNNEKR